MTDQLRWYVTPKYTGTGHPAPDIDLTNAAGELVATFESEDDAREAVEMHNRWVAEPRPVKEAS